MTTMVMKVWFSVLFVATGLLCERVSHAFLFSTVTSNKNLYGPLRRVRDVTENPEKANVIGNAVQNSIEEKKLESQPPTLLETESIATPNENEPKQEIEKSDPRPQDQYDAIIVGGGPAGLLTAIMLTQKYGPSYRVAVCERRSAIPPSPSDMEVWNDVARFYLLGIGFRGQRALRKFGVIDDFRKASVVVKGRRDWQPGQTKVEDGKVTQAQKDVLTSVLARDKLVGVLHHHLVNNYIDVEEGESSKIDLLYGYEVEPINFGNDNDDDVKVRIMKCEEVSASSSSQSSSAGTVKAEEYVASQDSQQSCDVDMYVESKTKLLIGADGAARTVANAMEKVDTDQYSKMNPLKRLVTQKPFKVNRYEDDNPRFFKSVPIRLPSDWPKDLNYSARSRDSRITLEALPSDGEGSLCALLLMKPDDEFVQPDVDATKLRQFFDDEFPQFGALIDDEEMARVAKKPASALPAFRYAGPKLHCGKRTLVLGDAAHTVKPYYGLGCNTAFEDVEILSEVLDNENDGAKSNDDPIINKNVVEEFSKRRGEDSKALVQISRNMDRPGKRIFFLTFVLPLILDGIFNKVAPSIFAPNMFRMFQRQDIGFKQIQRKKRLDRILQVSIIATGLSGIALGVKLAITNLAKAIGKSSKVVSLGLILTGLLGSTIQKMLTARATAKEGEKA